MVKVLEGRIAICIALLVSLLALPPCSNLININGSANLLREGIALAWGRTSAGKRGGNGYYESLMRRGSSSDRKPIERILDRELSRNISHTEINQDDKFLIYRAIPNLRISNSPEGPISTNSYGFFDREHSPNKPANTRRIAIIGDSVTRGWGVPMDKRFSTLLEHRLNSQSGESFEVLNFAVSGYLVTQEFYVATEDAPAFHPDVYVLALTETTLAPIWSDHLITLAESGRDLKYDFLRSVVYQSGMRKDDSPALCHWKLEPYGPYVVRTILSRLKIRTQMQSAELVVLLVPTASDRDETQANFRVVKQILAGMNIPVIDLTDTFNTVPIEPFRTNWYDSHPNIFGHQLIADNLYEKLRQNPQAWKTLTGQNIVPNATQAMARRDSLKVTDVHAR